MKFLILLLLSVVLLLGCDSIEQPTRDKKFETVTTKQVTDYLADQVYEPIILSMNEAALQLNHSLNKLCQAPSEQTLIKAQMAWKHVISQWRQSRSGQIAPIKSLYIYRKIDDWPVNETILETVIKDPSVHPGRDENSIYGFSAIEYFLFFDKKSDKTLDNIKDPKRCEYLIELGEDLVIHIQRISHYWFQKDTGAKAQFKSATGKYYLDEDEVLTNSVAQLLNVLEGVSWQRIGVPSNFFRGNENVKLLDAWRSQHSLENIQYMLKGLDNVYGDINSMGIYHLVYHKDPSLANEISEHLATIKKILSSLKNPLVKSLNNPPKDLKTLYKALLELKNLISDMADVLELKLVFEEDGD